MACVGLSADRPSETAAPHPLHLQEELAFFQSQLERYYGDGDCAYERSLHKAYEALVEQRQRQLAALREAGLRRSWENP